MNALRLLIWRWQMRKVRSGMTATEVERRLGAPTRTITAEEVVIWVYEKGVSKGMIYSIRVAFIDSAVRSVYLGMEAVETGEGSKPVAATDYSEPFMEHPTGEHTNAIAAMEDAICRLRELPEWTQWITFSAQGEDPARPGTIKFADVKLRQDKLDIGEGAAALPAILERARVPATTIRADGPDYSIAAASPREVALAMDAIFQHHFGIRPFADDDNDYAVGAEW